MDTLGASLEQLTGSGLSGFGFGVLGASGALSPKQPTKVIHNRVIKKFVIFIVLVIYCYVNIVWNNLPKVNFKILESHQSLKPSYFPLVVLEPPV